MEALQSYSHKEKAVMANINFIISLCSSAEALRLRERLSSLSLRWEPLEGTLKHRVAQLEFEHAQEVNTHSFGDLF